MDTSLFKLDPYISLIILFAATRKEPYKCLYTGDNSFVVTYKRIFAGRLQWPKNGHEIRKPCDEYFRNNPEVLRIFIQWSK